MYSKSERISQNVTMKGIVKMSKKKKLSSVIAMLLVISTLLAMGAMPAFAHSDEVDSEQDRLDRQAKSMQTLEDSAREQSGESERLIFIWVVAPHSNHSTYCFWFHWTEIHTGTVVAEWQLHQWKNNKCELVVSTNNPCGATRKPA